MKKTSLISMIAMTTVLASSALAQVSGMHVIHEIKVGGDEGWDYATVDQANHRLYVAHGSKISAVDLATGATSVHLADASGAHVALPVNSGADILITHGKANLVTINDAMTGAVKTSLVTDAKPDAAIVEPVTGRVFVMANGGNVVDVIDLKTQKVVGKIAVGGAPEAAAVDGNGLVFTHLEDKNSVVVLDAKTMTVKATFPIADCEEPSGIEFIPVKRFILSACKNGIARISQADSGVEVAIVNIGTRPDAALFDAKSNRGFIPSHDGKLTVISFEGTPHVVDVVTTQVGAKTGALDTSTGLIYLPTADFGPADAKTGRPTIVPGTFRILTVGQ